MSRNLKFSETKKCTSYENKFAFGPELESVKELTLEECEQRCSEHDQCDSFAFWQTSCSLRKGTKLTDMNGWKAALCVKGEIHCFANKIFKIDILQMKCRIVK